MEGERERARESIAAALQEERQKSKVTLRTVSLSTAALVCRDGHG